MTISTDEPYNSSQSQNNYKSVLDNDDYNSVSSSDSNNDIANFPDENMDNPKSTLIQISKQRSYGSLSSQILANERLTYTWKDIDVFGEIPNEGNHVGKRIAQKIKECFGIARRDTVPRKHLLKNVTGVAFSGEILAVLGSSGAGKTTLLNALAFRSPPGVKVSSFSVRALNGVQVCANELRSRCAYVQQDDLFIGSLTTREHLIFQAMLRMDRNVPMKQKLLRVDEVIAELSLSKCVNTIIGTPGRVKGLSGGERKRLAFASEALTDPNLLLCDEPTSGLDSFMAHSVLQVLKGLANKGKTIIITIHQPSSEIFGLFDKILLMAEGRVAFLGTPASAADFFTEVGAACPANYNPADYYVQLLAMAPNKETECRESIKRICDSFAVGAQAKAINEITVGSLIQKDSNYQEMNSPAHYDGNNGFAKEKSYRATAWTQFHAVLWRSWLSVLKEPMLVKVRLLQTTMVSLLIGVIFYGQKLDQDGVMNINGALFLFLTNMTFQNVFAVINVFCTELPIFLRESRSRLYSTWTYFLGKTLAELPLFLVVPFVFTGIAYPMIGLQPGFYHFFVACGIVALIANVSTSFGYLISCSSSSISVALSVGPPVIIPFLIFGGFFLNSGSVPYYFEWLSYLSWFRYGNEALLINQWATVGEGEILCTRSNTTCPSSGQIILETLNFDENDFMYDCIILLALIVLFRFLAYLALYFRTRSKE